MITLVTSKFSNLAFLERIWHHYRALYDSWLIALCKLSCWVQRVYLLLFRAKVNIKHVLRAVGRSENPGGRVLIQGQGVCFATIPAKIWVRVDPCPLSPFPFWRLWLCTKAALIQLILGTLFLYAYKDKNTFKTILCPCKFYLQTLCPE